LVDGRHEEPAAPGSSSKIITRIWGEPVTTDIDSDGTDDAVLILTQSTGGSGTFYYVVAAIATPAGYRGTAGILLGDRIRPQGIDVLDSKVRIRYLTRYRNQSFADDPELAQRMDVIYLVDDRQLAEVAIDFEGEADPDRMTLQMHTWTWVRTVFNNDTVKRPKIAGAFTLTFDEHGQVSGTTDCNSFRGEVIIEGRNIRFGENMAMTRMYCADSQESEFIGMLQSLNSFFFTSRGELIMEIKYDSGSMFFR
jgi:heat shock protein HslJ